MSPESSINGGLTTRAGVRRRGFGTSTVVLGALAVGCMTVELGRTESSSASTGVPVPALAVGPNGTGVLTFDALPGPEWSTVFLSGGTAVIGTTAELDRTVQAMAVEDVTNAVTATPTFPPGTYGAPIAARWNSTGRFLQTRAAGGSAALVFTVALRNETGSTQQRLDISYDMGVYSAVPAELPGYRVYYSLTGASKDWQLIPELSGIETNGGLCAPLNIREWTNNSLLYVLWIDDNADGVTDPGYTIDNLVIQAPPLLTISRLEPGSVEITWPAPSIGYNLESTDELMKWNPVSEDVFPSGNSHRVTVTLTGGTRFFRLRKPRGS